MITAHSESEVRIDWRLPNYTRSILAENHKALFRRWKIARSTELFDPRVLSRWFPGQRGLLDLLAVLSEEEVLRVADTKAPLFTMTLHDGLRPAASAARVQPGEFEAASSAERGHDQDRNHAYRLSGRKGSRREVEQPHPVGSASGISG